MAANGTLQFQTLMAHELAHHWWGDWVTTERAEEMWINEGIASYCESLFLERYFGRDDYDDNILSNHYDVLRYAHQNDSGHFAIDAVPLNITYGDHSYLKGADMMHTLRGYIGNDTLFFDAMKAVYQQYGNSHINSTEFRDGMNSVNGVDVTDFFADWVSKPGYPHFQIDNVNVTPDAGSYIVSVSLRQGLRDRSTYASNVPLTLSFIDSSWNEQQEVVLLNAYLQSFQFTLPFHPAEVMLNRHAMISDATTSIERIIDATGIVNLERANIRLIVNNVADSALVRVTHHWVGADDWAGIPQGIWLSTERYWEIEGVWDTASFDMDGRFEFNGQNNAVGDIDADFLIDLPGQPFIEDSLVLLYRETANDPWTIWPDYLLNTAGSNTNKFGFFVASELQKGQYAFGYRTAVASLQAFEESAALLTVYPNPAAQQFVLDTEQWQGMSFTMYDLTGKVIRATTIQGDRFVFTRTNESAGTYVVTISDGGRVEAAGKVVLE